MCILNIISSYRKPRCHIPQHQTSRHSPHQRCHAVWGRLERGSRNAVVMAAVLAKAAVEAIEVCRCRSCSSQLVAFDDVGAKPGAQVFKLLLENSTVLEIERESEEIGEEIQLLEQVMGVPGAWSDDSSGGWPGQHAAGMPQLQSNTNDTPGADKSLRL